MKRGIEVVFSQKPNDSIFVDFDRAIAYLSKGYKIRVKISDITRTFKPEEISEFEELHKIMTGVK